MDLTELLQKYWGFSAYRPLQEEAIDCVLGSRDSLVVLPTGGGKSLCFQAPALVLPGTAVVVSPLISLMKDQVDTLNGMGIDAAYLNSSLEKNEQREVLAGLRSGKIRILYVAPERLLAPSFLDLLSSLEVSFFAVDEAHCVSMWGHDFRPDYRGLAALKERFPGKAVHAYTATATEQVQEDICRELKLDSAQRLVGSFDRPNLVFRVQRRIGRLPQITPLLDRYKDESCIIYCIRRNDVDRLAAKLASEGYSALPYHAGLSDGERKQNQDAFLLDRAKIIVATVAFGMGIDKPNVRCVIHTGAPKSLEHYQQETGRAGRDGLEADCRLYFSGGDFAVWRRFIDEMDPEPRAVALQKLYDMYDYCRGLACRHRSLSAHFGQELEQKNCEACDVCLGEIDVVDDALILGQKILSCVVRLQEGYGAHYTAAVLCGSKDQRILTQGHDGLSTYGLLSDLAQPQVRDWVEQLVDQEYLVKMGDYHLLRLTQRGARVLRGEETPPLLKPAEKAKPAKAVRGSQRSWEGVDRDLFEELRTLRFEKAKARGVPAYVVFGDAALRDMARLQPTTKDEFLQVHGVGQKKCAEFGTDFIAAIRDYREDKQQAQPMEGEGAA